MNVCWGYPRSRYCLRRNQLKDHLWMALRLFRSCVCSCTDDGTAQKKKLKEGKDRKLTDSLKAKGYSVGKKIGTGAYSTVHEAWTPKGERLAAKIIDKRKLATSSLRVLSKYFDQEMQILSNLNNVNIIKLYDTMEMGSKLYIIMELADGGDLLDYINQHGMLGEPKTKRLFRQLCHAVYHCHMNRIAHRDLKCENVLLTKNIDVKLSDFGFACYCYQMSETYCGSAAYSAPEIIQERPYNPMISDAWGLGVILFTMVSAAMPFDESNLHRLLDDQLKRNWHFPKHAASVLSSDVRQLINDILEPDTVLRLNVTQIIESKWLQST